MVDFGLGMVDFDLGMMDFCWKWWIFVSFRRVADLILESLLAHGEPLSARGAAP